MIAFAAFAIPLCPSPALSKGLLVLAAPAVMLLPSGALLALHSSTQGLRDRDLIVAIVGGAYVFGSVIDAGADRWQRVVARLLVVLIALAIGRRVHLLPVIHRAFVLGAVAACLIAIASAVLRVSVLGGEILPGRNFLIPIDVAKTTGLPRSFGEMGIIVVGGLSGVRLLPAGRVRTGAAAILMCGAFVAQSRNVLLTVVLFLAVAAIHRARSITAPVFAIGAITVVLLPLLLDANPLGVDLTPAQLVGDGIYARNVQLRFDQFADYSRAVADGTAFNSLDGMTRAQWRDYSAVAPHNHFLSLMIFDGVLGAISIIGIWGTALVVLARSAQDRFAAKHLWFLAALAGLSFYEGAFSPSVAIVLGMALAAPLPIRRGLSRG